MRLGSGNGHGLLSEPAFLSPVAVASLILILPHVNAHHSASPPLPWLGGKGWFSIKLCPSPYFTYTFGSNKNWFIDFFLMEAQIPILNTNTSKDTATSQPRAAMKYNCGPYSDQHTH